MCKRLAFVCVRCCVIVASCFMIMLNYATRVQNESSNICFTSGGYFLCLIFVHKQHFNDLKAISCSDNGYLRIFNT